MTKAILPSHVRSWLAEPLPVDVAASLQRLAVAQDVRRMAVMPDVHLAEQVCVGVAVATTHVVYPHAVGGDIGCGMAAVALDVNAARLADQSVAGRILGELYRAVPCNRHSKQTLPELPPDLSNRPLSDPRLSRLRDRDGRVQFGTLGRGNHFVELQQDEQGRLWLMVHSGSRAMGQAITRHHLEHADPGSLPSLSADDERGQAYLRDVEWAVDYAMASRLQMVRAVAEWLNRVLGVSCDWSTVIHGNHNHVRFETHGGERLLVHRKGALPAFEDELGVIPGSMGTSSFHVAGRGSAESLCSSSHGAGRAMSRAEARQQVSCRRLFRELGGVWFDHRRADALRDEAPSAYKDIGKVMRAQRDLTCIVRELTPVLCYKGT